MHVLTTLADTLLARLAWTSAQAVALIALLGLLMRVMPRLSPAIRCMLWWLVAAQLILGITMNTPVQLHWLAPARLVAVAAADQVIVHTHVHAGAAAIAITPDHARIAPASQITWSWSLAIAMAWLSGLLLQGLLAARQWLEGVALLRHAQPLTNTTLLAVCSRQARALRMRRLPQLRISHAIVSPQVTGLWRPVVLLPGEQTLSTDELSLAMAHELAHIRRGDLWLGWIPAIAQRLFFFHPLVQWAMREYAVYREAACDADVVQRHGTAAQSYGHLLVRLGVVNPVHASLAGASSTFLNLKRRLIMLQQDDTTPRMRSWLLIAVIAIVGVLPYRVTAQQPSATQRDATSVNTPPAPPAAPLPPSAAMPLTASVPPLPPPAPAAPMPPAPPAAPDIGFHAHQVDIDTEAHADRGFALLDGDTVVIHGSDADLAQAERLDKSNQPVLWVRQNGKSYVVRDTNVIQRAKDISAQAVQVARMQAEVAGKQAAMAGQQAAIAERQAELASRQSEVEGRRADIDAQRQALRAATTSLENAENEASLNGQLRGIQREEAEIQRETASINQAAATLSKRAAERSQRDAEISAQQQLRSQEFDRQMDKLLNDAIAKGLAKPANP
ncbi:peptidase M56 [Dyella monticola]|uniref:Peptidase M56 n=1 Tax=Dyella monticola TaxID=1927958 RepID=A0A370WSU8_9GAMM|nr:M56 family metallopeptidase [Dyella monticola]RDS79200.1 peptidase M56 [Dyella monticola]